MKNKFLLTIVGPTAIGKTALSIAIAKHFQTEIISADSRQFFKEMKIGTAVPSEAELKAVPHHFIQNKSITEAYSVGDFEREAIQKLDILFKDHNVVVMVGGSGLYVNSVIKGLNDFPEIDPEIRQNLNLELEKSGLSSIQKKLQKLDPEYFAKVDKENPHRLIRALEISISTGKPYSFFLKKKKPARDFKTISIGLTAPREIIYKRINQRVDVMVENGLFNEAKALEKYKHLNALNTVGYKEIFAHFEGKLSAEEAILEIQKNTRRFAKRQLTWFRKEGNIQWFEHTAPVQNIISFIETSMRP